MIDYSLVKCGHVVHAIDLDGERVVGIVIDDRVENGKIEILYYNRVLDEMDMMQLYIEDITDVTVRNHYGDIFNECKDLYIYDWREM